ncbi:signal-regulatory protein beta-2-like [Myripristis murdjan]|uniref:signal-regulatory protein beta-2-like n=1 Tax=Myripristis murdjan TaxID=586833 RepID=UPI001176016C|nr:signal-regulatory protein beta-2-like [Myripristis murdjan]
MIIYFPTVFLLCHLCVAQFTDISQPVSVKTAELGDSVTIECQINSVVKTRVWYRATTGRKLQLVAKIDKKGTITFGSQFNQYNKLYSVKLDGVRIDLHMWYATRGDIGTYYCGVVYADFIDFGSGTFLQLKGILPMKVSVAQQPESESVHPGDSVTLSCSVHTGDCGGEHTSVFWLKSSESSGPQIILAGNKSESCERTESGSPETSCVYKLPKQNLSSDDAGTYYCVVASCGETLFGNGTELHIKGNSILTPPSHLDSTVVALACSTVIFGMAAFLLLVPSETLRGLLQ